MCILLPFNYTSIKLIKIKNEDVKDNVITNTSKIIFLRDFMFNSIEKANFKSWRKCILS